MQKNQASMDPSDGAPSANTPFFPRKSILYILIGVLIVAAGLRFWDYDFHRYDQASSTGMFNDQDKKLRQAMKVFDESVPFPDNLEPFRYKQPYGLIYTSAAFLKFTQLFGEEGFNDYWDGVVIYTILVALLTVALLFFMGRLVFARDGPWVALLATFFLAVVPINVAGSRYFKEDIPLMFATNVAIFALLLLLKHGKSIYYLVSGLVIGLAIGTKYAASTLVIFYFVAHILNVFQAEREERLRTALSPGFFGGILMIPLGFLIFNPYVLVQFGAFWAGIVDQTEAARYGHNDGMAFSGKDYLWTFYLRYALVPGVGIPILAAALVGLATAIRRKNVLALFFFAWLAFFYYGVESSHLKAFPFFARYAHPLVPGVCLFAAFGVLALCAHCGKTARGKAIQILLISICIAPPLTKTVLINLSTKDDTRFEAAGWLETHAAPNMKIFIAKPEYAPVVDKQKWASVKMVKSGARTYTEGGRNRAKYFIRQYSSRGYRYLVLSSFHYDRYSYAQKFNEHGRQAHDWFKTVFETLPLKKEFKPRFAWQTYGFHNPVIRIYDLKTGNPD